MGGPTIDGLMENTHAALRRLTGYFDESGSDAGNEYYIVAGFVSTVEKWDRFDGDWKAVLRQFKVSSFHAHEFDNGRRGFGPYKDWDEERRRDFMGKLLGIIVRRTHKSFGTATHKKSLDIVLGNSDIKRYYGGPFSVSFFNTVHAVSEYRKKHYPSTPIVHIFDEGNSREGAILQAAKTIRLQKGDTMIEDIRPGNDETITPLQAADLLAFEFCSEKRRQAQRPEAYSRYALQYLDDHPRDWLQIDATIIESNLRSLIEQGVFYEKQSEV
jgi:hypothetical protein